MEKKEFNVIAVDGNPRMSTTLLVQTASKIAQILT